MYEPKDWEFLMNDVVTIQKFFIAKDDKGIVHGLAEHIVVGSCTRLKTIIANLMEYSTEFLVEQYQTAPESFTDVFTKQSILCTLIHRRDKLARTFLHNHHLTPFYKGIKRGNVVLQQET